MVAAFQNMNPGGFPQINLGGGMAVTNRTTPVQEIAAPVPAQPTDVTSPVQRVAPPKPDLNTSIKDHLSSASLLGVTMLNADKPTETKSPVKSGMESSSSSTKRASSDGSGSSYECGVCHDQMRFSSLARHMRESHGVRPLALKDEPMVVLNKLNIKETCRINSLTLGGLAYYRSEPNNQHLCHICNRGYKVEHSLMQHLKVVHGRQPIGSGRKGI